EGAQRDGREVAAALLERGAVTAVLRGHHALGDVVHALETALAAVDHDVAARPEMIERLPRRFAAVPGPGFRSRTLRALEVARGEGTAFADAVENAGDHGGVLGNPGMPFVFGAVGVHRVPEIGEGLDRYD